MPDGLVSSGACMQGLCKVIGAVSGEVVPVLNGSCPEYGRMVSCGDLVEAGDVEERTDSLGVRQGVGCRGYISCSLD